MGQRSAAAQQFQRCANLLQAELKILPMPETIALYRAIVEERFTTIVIYPGQTAELDRYGNYVVTSAPVGAIVPYIPDAAEEREGEGGTTYTYNGVTYQPVSLNGDTSYVVSSTT